MEVLTVVVIAVLAAAIAAVGVAILARRLPLGGLGEPRDDARTGQLEAELTALREANSGLERRLAAEEQKALRVPDLEASLAERGTLTDSLRDAKAAVELDLAKTAEALAQIKEARDRAAAQTEATIGDLRQRLEAAERARAETAERLDALAREKAGQERAAAEKSAHLDATTAALDKTRVELNETATALKSARDDAAALRTREARLQETLDQEKKHSEAKLALLSEARERMSKEFKVLAEEVMKNHGDAFSKQNKEQIDGLLSPLRDKLVEFQQGLQTAHTETAKERATLGEQIRNLTMTSAQMTNETHNLTRALKGKGQTQGAWGEMILSTILERSGLREGEEYVTQESHSSEDGARLRPDVVVNLPGGQRIIVDSKVSLTAFEAYVNAESDANRAVHLKSHLTSLRAHIKALASKEYHALTGDGLDYVIMFVPIEGALAAALQDDPALTGFAAENNVAIATPTTLMIALRTVSNVWQVERRNRNAEAIAKRAGAIYDKFVGFLDDMDKLGAQLGKATENYHGAMNKLSIGKGNIVGQVAQLKDMGAKASKSLPKHLLDGDDDDARALPSPGNGAEAV